MAEPVSLQGDVALLDIGLPGASGIDLARQRRSQTWGDDMPLIAVTGWGQTEDRDRTARAGFARTSSSRSTRES